MKIFKKAQHEIAGFVLIVLVVSIIGVIFLSIMFAKGGIGEESSVEVSKLLYASMYYTTDCAIEYPPYFKSIQELVEDCNEDRGGNLKECIDGRGACEVLESNLKELLDKSLDIGEDFVNKAYKLDIYYYEREDIPSKKIIEIQEGVFQNCSSIVGGWTPAQVNSLGTLILEVKLLVCKS